ncbi:MAG: pyruvate kinase [Promethearchaeota archaeon]
MVSLKKIKKSKIVCTIGPACDSEDMLKKLINAGMNVARLNFSHNTQEYHAKIYNLIRKIDNHVAILCDIQGPKIRIGKLKSPQRLIPGNDIKIIVDAPDDFLGDDKVISISHRGFLNDVEKGDFVYINDGLIKLRVEEINKDEKYALCKVLLGGMISDRKGVNIPKGHLSTKNPTEKDIKDLKFIAKLNPEYVAASFVANADEVELVRRILENEGSPDIKIISKIERPIALENFDEILEASDGIMVARGDLGVEIPLEELPLKQKEIILKSNRLGKPVIVATQMLESMISQPRPTRAEVSDVFNAIFDRADAVMLSGETSVGKYPVETVSIMNTIVMNAERHIPPMDPNKLDSVMQETYETIGHGVYTLSEEFLELNYRGKIVCFTKGGKSARMISKYRPPLPILSVTDNITTARQLQLIWGVEPLFIEDLNLAEKQVESIIMKGLSYLIKHKYLNTTDHVIVTIPSRVSPRRSAFIGLYYLKDILSEL